MDHIWKEVLASIKHATIFLKKFVSESSFLSKGAKNKALIYGGVGVISAAIIARFPVILIFVILGILIFFLGRGALRDFGKTIATSRVFFSSKGRIGRREFWFSVIAINFFILSAGLFVFLISYIFALIPVINLLVLPAWIIGYGAVFAGGIWTLAATCIKRCKDIGINPHLLWLMLIPTGVTNLIGTILLGCLPSNMIERSYEDLASYAAKGDPEAQYELGLRFETGYGVLQSYSEAIKWYNESANNGYVHAAFHLAGIYEKGEVVARNALEAVRLYELAANQGHAEAQGILGVILMNGVDGIIAQNYIEAHKWFNLSAACANAYEGNIREGSIKFRDYVAELMTPDEILKAQEMASLWRAMR